MTEGILNGALLELLSESGLKGLGRYFQSLYVSDKNAEAGNRHTPKMLCFSFQVCCRLARGTFVWLGLARQNQARVWVRLPSSAGGGQQSVVTRTSRERVG